MKKILFFLFIFTSLSLYSSNFIVKSIGAMGDMDVLKYFDDEHKDLFLKYYHDIDMLKEIDMTYTGNDSFRMNYIERKNPDYRSISVSMFSDGMLNNSEYIKSKSYWKYHKMVMKKDKSDSTLSLKLGSIINIDDINLNERNYILKLSERQIMLFYGFGDVVVWCSLVKKE